MKDQRPVTERDFRKPEFADANPADYEFRDDGAIVRKDRWITGMHSIAAAVGLNNRSGFEIPDVVRAVLDLAETHQPEFWRPMTDLELDGADGCQNGQIDIHVKLRDGSTLKNAHYRPGSLGVNWRDSVLEFKELVGWRRT